MDTPLTLSWRRRAAGNGSEVRLPGLATLFTFADARHGGRYGWTLRCERGSGPAASHADEADARREAARVTAAKLRTIADALEALEP